METQQAQARSPRVQVIAEALGEESFRNWQGRMREGIIVDLTIKRIRGRKKLDWDELGIVWRDQETKAVFHKLLSLGSKLLLPIDVADELESTERYARQILTNYAYKTPFGYFLPYTSYAVWREKNEEFQQRYFSLRDDLVENYNEHVEALLKEYEKIGRHTYERLAQQAQAENAGYIRELMVQRGWQTEEAFVIYFCDKVRFHIPNPEQIYTSFVYDTELRRITLPDVLSPQSQRVGELDIDETLETQERERTEAREQEQEAQRKAVLMEQMNQAVVADAQQRKEQLIGDFFGSLLAQLRGLTYEVATDVLEAIRKHDGEAIRGRSIIQIRNLLEQVKNLNFYGDADIEGMMSKLQVVVDQPPKDRDVRDIQRQLRNIALVTRRTLLELGEGLRGEREERDLDIPDLPTDEQVRDARLELDLPVTITGFDHNTREERAMAEALPLHLDMQNTIRSEREEWKRNI